MSLGDLLKPLSRKAESRKKGLPAPPSAPIFRRRFFFRIGDGDADGPSGRADAAAQAVDIVTELTWIKSGAAARPCAPVANLQQQDFFSSGAF
jgi:hypothetical protein